MTPETILKNEIKLWCGRHNWLCFHINEGTFYTKNGSMIKMDTPNGFPDLLIITDNAKVMFMETKIHPRKPTNEQLKMQKELRDRGFISDTVYSLEEFIKKAEILINI